jgi:hypothetical protein
MRWSLLRYDDCWQRNAYCATVNAQHQRMDANRANATGLAAEMCAASKWSLCSLASREAGKRVASSTNAVIRSASQRAVSKPRRLQSQAGGSRSTAQSLSPMLQHHIDPRRVPRSFLVGPVKQKGHQRPPLRPQFSQAQKVSFTRLISNQRAVFHIHLTQPCPEQRSLAGVHV